VGARRSARDGVYPRNIKIHLVSFNAFRKENKQYAKGSDREAIVISVRIGSFNRNFTTRDSYTTYTFQEHFPITCMFNDMQWFSTV
jgi:hypothetical protein